MVGFCTFIFMLFVRACKRCPRVASRTSLRARQQELACLDLCTKMLCQANETVPKKATLGCKDEATMAACSQLGTLKSGVLLRARKALVAAQAEDTHHFTAPAPVLDSLLPLLHALGAVADVSDSHKSGATTATVALTGSLDQVLACVDEAREARAAAFNDELSSELKTLGLPELTQSLLSISPEEDDGKCAFLSASQLYRTGTGTQAKNGRASDETTQATKKHGRRS